MIALCATLAVAQQSDPDQLLKTAISEQQGGDYRAAIRDYRKVLELRPNLVEAKVNLAAALVHVGEYDTAIAMYRAALPALSFKNPVLLNLGLAYYKKGDFENAREQFETLHKAQPGEVRVVVLLADSELHLNKSTEALELPRASGRFELAESGFRFRFRIGPHQERPAS